MHSVALSSMPYPAGFTTSTSRTLPSDLTTSERITSPCARTFLAKSGISQVLLNITEGGGPESKSLGQLHEINQTNAIRHLGTCNCSSIGPTECLIGR